MIQSFYQRLIEELVKFLTTQVSRPIKRKEERDDGEAQNMRNVKRNMLYEEEEEGWKQGKCGQSLTWSQAQDRIPPFSPTRLSPSCGS